MRRNGKGNVVCEKGEVRVGNFFWKRESDGYVKLSDLNGVLRHRVSSDIPLGMLVDRAVGDMLSGGDDVAVAEKFLHNYAALVYYFSCTVPVVKLGDDGEPEYDFYALMLDVLNGCVERGREIYGVKEDPTDEEEAAVLEGLRDAAALEEELADLEKEDGR